MLWTFLAIISLHAFVSLVFLMGAMKVCTVLVSSVECWCPQYCVGIFIPDTALLL